MMRGPIAGLLSFSGGMMSLLIIVLIASLWKEASYLIISISGAITHNLTQLVIASWLTSSVGLLLFLMPLMLTAAIVAGSLTAILLRVVMPVFKKIPTGILRTGTGTS
jgi:heptaprenyl diphosphate synthase